MTTTLTLDPSRPYQIEEDLLVIWLPRGRGREAIAQGLASMVEYCDSPTCPCTDAWLYAVPIDDRAKKVVCDKDDMDIAYVDLSSKTPRPEGSAWLEVNFLTGQVRPRDPEEKNLPSFVAPFFEEPLPYWVLDHLFARWRAKRPPLSFDWRVRALKVWRPGVLLPTALVCPDERNDRYLLDGKLYQVNTLFCVEPGCTCNDTRLYVVAFRENNIDIDEIGAASLPTDTCIFERFDGAMGDLPTFTRLYHEWCRRNVPPRERLEELRALTRQRGLELYRFIETQAQHRSQPSFSLSRPGRNDPCPCGSGKKYKRCCGR